MYFQNIWLKNKNYLYNQPLWIKVVALVAVFFITIFFILYFTYLCAPANYPTGSVYTVEKGISLGEVAGDLQNRNIIRSSFWLKTIFYLYYGSNNLNYGDYILDAPENVFTLTRRLANSEYHIKTARITIPEGLNRSEIASLLKTKLYKVTESEFLAWSKKYEGYLFPDTYFWLENVTASEVVTALNLNFEKQTKYLQSVASSSKRSFSDIVKVASIVELEANNKIDRKIIADIIWRRLKIGIPLQVNASLKYIGVKDTFVLTTEQTKIDSPYNTYKYKGLPPTPISNPGLEALEATVSPTANNYLYFLTGRDGKMYYARTYDEHLQNKQKYLK
ncbi:MAG: endolytic transglycosylase MltG [Minisyncoccia bacterium]